MNHTHQPETPVNTTPGILYSSASSPHCFKVSMILHEKNVSFQRVEINLRTKEQKTPAYLAINPLGQVPVYEDEQGVHIDSLVIMQHLDKRYPDPPLFPADPETNQQVLEWIDVSSTTMRDVSHHLYWQLLEPPADGTDHAEVTRLMTLGYEMLEKMERALSKNTWLCGDISAADYSVFAWVYGFARFDLPSSWDAYPHVHAWRERLAARPGVTASYQVKGRTFQAFLNDKNT